MTDLNPNWPLLDKTLAHIEANPEQHVQWFYRCRTGMCFAGWAVELDGGKWYSNDPSLYCADLLVTNEEDPPEDCGSFDGTRVIDVADRARRILGLDAEAASDLFAATNTIDDIKMILDELREVAP